MEIIQKENTGVVCIAINSRICAEPATELERAINKIVADGNWQVLFDLSALEYLRTPILRVILKAVKQINRKRGQVALCSLNS